MVIPKICKLMLGLLLLNCFNNSNASMQENNNIINNNTSDIYRAADSVLTFLNPFEKLNNMVNTIDAIITLDNYPIDAEKVNKLVDMNYDKRNAENLVFPLRIESNKNNDLKVLYSFKDYQEHKREILSHWVETTLKDYLNNAGMYDNTDPKIEIETVFKYLTSIIKIENDKFNNIVNRVLNMSDNKKQNIFNYIKQNFEKEIDILKSSYYDKIKMLTEKYENVEKEIQDVKDKIDGEIYDNIMKEHKGRLGFFELPVIEENKNQIDKKFCILFSSILQYLDNLDTLLQCISCPNNK